MTTYHLRSADGIEVFTGTITPPPGGGSQPGVAQFPFAFDLAGLAAGVTFYTPTADDVAAGLWLLDAWFQINTAWDGTTPLGDIGTFVGNANGLWQENANAVDMTVADGQFSGTGILWSQNPSLSGSLISVAAGYRVVPARITATNPLKVVVSQNGSPGGADPAATQGAAILCYRIGKP